MRPAPIPDGERCDCGHDPGEPCMAFCQCGHAANQHMWFDPHPCGTGASCACRQFRATRATRATPAAR